MILYLGLDPKNFPRKEGLIHYPVIRTQIIGVWTDEMRAALSSATHLIFTSQTAARYFLEQGSCEGKQVLAVGRATQQSLGGMATVAEVETQEGVIALIERLQPRDPYFFWPRSRSARALLERYLQKYQHKIFDLYDTFPQRLGPVPSLDAVEEIVFTSPSTVHAFIKIYGAIPMNKKLTAIGPVTEKTLMACCHKSVVV